MAWMWSSGVQISDPSNGQSHALGTQRWIGSIGWISNIRKLQEKNMMFIESNPVQESLPLILISREPGAPKHEPKNNLNRIWPIGLLLKSPTKLSCIICNIQGTLWIPIVASSRFHNPFWCDLISRLVVLRSCGLPCGGTRIFRTPAQCLQLTGLRCH